MQLTAVRQDDYPALSITIDSNTTIVNDFIRQRRRRKTERDGDDDNDNDYHHNNKSGTHIVIVPPYLLDASVNHNLKIQMAPGSNDGAKWNLVALG